MAFDLAENVHIPTDVNKYLQKISAFIDVPANFTEKNVPSLLTRHYAKFKYHPQSPERIKLLTPISDRNIAFSLSRLKFNHPYTLISFLNDPNYVPPTDINAYLQPFCLYKNNPQCNSEKLIPLLARMFGKKPNEFLVYFQGKQINEKTIRNSWTQLFIDPNDPSSKQRVTDNEMPYFFERLISNFPSENWSLNSLEDLYSLHVLSCAMKIKLILIFPPLAGKSKSTYSLCIGRQNSSYCIYVGIITKDRFFIAEPLLKEKKIELNKPKPKQTTLLKSFETMDKNFAIYYDYQNNANCTKTVSVYSGKIYELPKIDRPSLECIQSSSDPSILNVNVRIPAFNKDNKVILHSFLESICNSVTEIARTPNDANNQVTQMTLKNSFKLVGKSLNTYYLMSREVKEKEQRYSEFGKVTSPSQLMAVCKEIYDQGYVFDQSKPETTKLSHLSAFRILAGNILSDNKISIEPVLDSIFKPIFLPKTSRISLADCCNSKYAEDICTLSILRYCVGYGQDIRICDSILGCGEIVAPDAIVLPIRNQETQELTFLCPNCIKNLRSRRKGKVGVAEAFSATNNKDVLIMRLQDTQNPPDIFSYIKTYENNICYLHEHPIGYLRQMINMIDNAFSTLQHILVAKSIIDAQSEASLSQMLGIRDGNEANIQLTRIGSPPDNVPIDYNLFKNYLTNQADIQYSSSLYHFVKRNDEIIKEIDESIEKSYIDHIVEQLQRRDNKTVPSYYIQGNPTDPRHLMNFTFSFDLIGDKTKKTTKYTYKLYPIDNASHLSISPIAIITTSKNIFNIWKYDDSSVVILACDDADTTKYTDAYVYHLKIGTVNLDYAPVFCKLENVRLSCADLCATNAQHELTVYYQNPKVQNIMTIDFHSKIIRHENHEYSQVFNCFYAFDKVLFTLCSINTPVLVNSQNDKQIPINPDEVAFIANPLYLLCVYSNGLVSPIDLTEHSVSPEEEEEEGETQDKLIINNLSIKEPLFSSIDSNNQPGITNLKRTGDDSYDAQFCTGLGQLYENFQTTLAPGANEAFFNQYGYADDFSSPNDPDSEQKRKANLNIWNFHLTAAEFFPVLVSYESHGLQTVITKDMEPFCPIQQNESFPSNIRSYYTRLYSHISLHHVEEVIRCHKLTVNIVSFISDTGNDETARFIDTIFGTRFAAVTQEGIYVAVRVINGIAHIITFCNCDTTNKDQLMRQLSAMYRASDYVCICTSKLINSLNFLKEWTDSIPDAYALGPRQSALPTMVTFFFNSSGDLSRSKLQKYQAKYNIESEIITVPRRQSWNTRGMDDLIESKCEEEEEEADLDDLDDAEQNEDEIDSESHHIKQFLDTIEDMVHCLKYRKWKADKQQNASNPDDSNFRKPYRPETGIRFVIEQIATYLTLNEFKDFPIDTVLKYCHLQISK